MTDPDLAATPDPQIEAIRLRLRKITHELSSPLGVLRLTAHYLQTQNVDPDQIGHYMKVVNDSVDRLEDGLHRLRALADPGYRPQEAPNEDSR